MDLSILNRTYNNSKHHQKLFLKFGDFYLIFLTSLMLEGKVIICFLIIKYIFSHCYMFSVFVIAAINKHILIASSVSQKTPFVRDIIVSATKRRRNIKILLRLSAAVRKALVQFFQNCDFYCFTLEKPFLSNFGPKI